MWNVTDEITVLAPPEAYEKALDFFEGDPFAVVDPCRYVRPGTLLLVNESQRQRDMASLSGAFDAALRLNEAARSETVLARMQARFAYGMICTPTPLRLLSAS